VNEDDVLEWKQRVFSLLKEKFEDKLEITTSVRLAFKRLQE